LTLWVLAKAVLLLILYRHQKGNFHFPSRKNNRNTFQKYRQRKSVYSTFHRFFHNSLFNINSKITKIKGQWTITAIFDNEDVKGSPYVFDVFDPEQVEIKSTIGAKNFIHKNISFDIDASKAGKGLVTAQVLLGNREFPINIKELKDNSGIESLYNFNFVPSQAGSYRCNIFFNNKPVKGMCRQAVCLRNNLNETIFF
jgi:hypothetical protein